MALTDTRIRDLRAKETTYRKRDGGGLYLVVKPSGARLWHYRYRIGASESMYAIGAYPEVSLAEAREARNAARKLVKQGINPSHQRKADKLRVQYETANTFAAVGREWLASNRSHWTPRTYRQRERLLDVNVFPHVGMLPMRQVTPAHAHAVLKRIEARAPQMAVLARQCFSAISQLAIATARADLDLGYPLRNSVKLRPVTHKKPLRAHQIPGFFRALDSYAGYFQTKEAVYLLWYTLARPVEVIAAKWSEFDLDEAIWSIPAGRMKMRQPHDVPLPRQAVERLRALKAITGNSEFLVPSRKTPKKHAAHSLLVKAFTAMGYTGKFSPHGIRVTGRTILGEQGHPRDVLERQLAHREKKEVRAYDQGDRLEARKKVMQGWADYLDGLLSGANVVPIGARNRA